MTKKTRVTMKEAYDKSMEAKERFVYGREETPKPSKSDSRIEVKPNRGTEVKGQEVKKASCYLPLGLWVKYKAYELDQARQGKSSSLNGLIVELLNKRLEKY